MGKRKESRDSKYYACTENDNEVWVELNDGEIEELQIGTIGDGSWTVLGIEDLKLLLLKHGYELKLIIK